MIKSMFNKKAAEVVDENCTRPDGGKIEGEDRDILIWSISDDMEIGSALTRPLYLAMGTLSGALITCAVGAIVKKWRKKHAK